MLCDRPFDRFSSALLAVAVAAAVAAPAANAAAQASPYVAEPPAPAGSGPTPNSPPAQTAPENSPEPAADPEPAEPPPAEPQIDLNAPPPSAAPPAPPAATRGVAPIVYVPYKPPSEDLIVSNRELGGHHFPLAVFVPPALTFSYFGVRAGLEYHRVNGFSRDISFFGSSTFSEATLETVNAAETVDVALRVHDYIALLGSAYGLARVGANESTLLGSGADYTYGGNVGMLVKLFRVAGFQLAVRGEAGYFAGQQAGIIELFQDIGLIVQTNINELVQTTDIRTVNLPARLNAIESAIRTATSAILTPFRGFEYGGSLNAAQSLGSAMGLQLSLGVFGKAETYDIPVFSASPVSITANPRDVNKFWPRLAAAFDIDFQSSLGIPLDLVAEYMLTRLTVDTHLDGQVETRAWTEHVIALGGYYAGALNLQLGIVGYLMLGKHPDETPNGAPSGEPLDVGAQFVFRYLR